ncbi:cytochrome P450 [Dendrothele bispora CBS 962.96]|uniref:Cytochrome P450 n=1 Tax=Dendrothele bispora (strain CBS 962.96) TaxID=1314807 RepID=A0A4S8LS11_DENBC|nr:cytochrome P450 [Dendrothele bispora CBS 962.96]
MSTKLELTPFLTATILFGLYHSYVFLIRLFRPRLPYPLGPRGYPLIGDLFNEASKNVEQHEWARYLKMGKEYNSDVLHINVLGDHTLILNSAKAATELLEKRSGLYSDRPRKALPSLLSRWDWNFATMLYSNKWRSVSCNLTFHQDFQAKAISTYHPFILQSTSNFLKKLAPAEYISTSYAGSTILRIVYGMSTQEELENYVELAHLASESLNATMNHCGSFFVDYLPCLKYMPAWFPGASFKQKANTWAPMVSNLINAPWKRVKSSMKFNLVPNFDIKSINNNLDQDMEEVIKNCSGVAYFAGTDTTVSLIMSSILVLSHHPEVLEKAHEELDRVIGTSRLPQFQDRDKLPYIQAFIKEVERMYPVTPLAVAHRVISDDIFNGYFIPKGIVNSRIAILHSEELYQDPFKFNPGRFLQNDKNSKLSPDPEIVAFGFGRRICPGRHFALDSAWSLIACLLATCDFTGPSEDAQKISRKPDPMLDYFDGLIV